MLSVVRAPSFLARGEEGEALLHDAFPQESIPIHEHDTVVEVMLLIHQLIQHVGHALAFAALLSNENDFDFAGAIMLGQGFPKDFVLFLTAGIDNEVEDGGDGLDFIENTMKHPSWRLRELRRKSESRKSSASGIWFLRVGHRLRSDIWGRQSARRCGPE